MSNQDLIKERLRAKLEALTSPKYQKKEKRTWSPKEASTVRAIRYPHNTDPESEPFAQAWFHYNFPGVRFGIYCPKFNQKADKCPACEFVEKLKTTRQKEDYKFAMRLSAQRKTLVPVVDRADPEAKPKLWTINSTVEAKLIKWLLDVDTEMYLDPVNGYDIKITLVEKNKFKMPDVDLARRESRVGDDDTTKRVLSSVPKVEDAYEVMSYEKIKTTIEDAMKAESNKSTANAVKEDDNEIIKGGGSSEETLEVSSDAELQEAFRSAREPLE
jgi:hypothetical protein